MVEVLCIWHHGIHCALPSRQVLNAEPRSRTEPSAAFWECGSDAPQLKAERSLNVVSASGTAWIEASQPVILTISAAELHALPPLLRELVPLAHVVGLAEVQKELIWLVDAKRFRGAASCATASSAADVPSKSDR